MSDNEFDPREELRQARDSVLDLAGRVADAVVSSELYAVTMGRAIRTFSQVIAPVRAQMEAVSEVVLEAANLPSRAQIIELAKRVNRVETILDDLDYKTDELLDKGDDDD